MDDFSNASQEAGGRAMSSSPEQAILPAPAPTYPADEAGPLSDNAAPATGQSASDSGEIPRKGRRTANSAAPEQAKISLPSDEERPGSANRNARNSAKSRTRAGATKGFGNANDQLTVQSNGAPRTKATESDRGRAIAHSPEQASPVTPAPVATDAEIIALARTRRDWQQMRQRSYLHALAICRSACGGDKKAAVVLYKATEAGENTSVAVLLEPAIIHVNDLTRRIEGLEKTITAQMKALPIWPYIERQKGLGAASVASLISCTGSPAMYSTSAKLIKGAGLAVAECGTKRQALIVPGSKNYRNARAAAFVLAAGAIKAGNPQMRELYDRQKAAALAKGWPKLRAHLHGMRCVSKKIVKHLWENWNV